MNYRTLTISRKEKEKAYFDYGVERKKMISMLDMDVRSHGKGLDTR
jgi:hypothetical protein